MTNDRFGRLPHRYVLCTQDLAVLPALQRRLIAELDTVSMHPTVVHELDASHSPFLSVPGRLARILAGDQGSPGDPLQVEAQ